MSDEEIIEGLLTNPATEEEKEVAEYKAPSSHRLLFSRRVFEIEGWCAKQGILERDEVVSYVQTRWRLNREQAMKYVDEVIKDFSRSGHVYGQQVNAKREG
jgi:hypothetical protein